MMPLTHATLADFTTTFAGLLLDTAAKATVLLLLATVAALLFRRASAAARHLIWTAAIAGLFLLPALSWALPAWRILPLPAWAEPAAPAARAPLLPPVAPAPPAFLADPAPTPQWTLPTLPPTVPTNTPAVSPTVPAPLMQASTPATPPAPPMSTAAALLWFWAAGAACLLAPLLISFLFLARLARRATPLPTPWQHLLHHLQSLLHIPRRVALKQSSRGTVPMTFGILRPTILLPVNTWPAERRQIVLLHELAHIRRQDCLTQLLARLARALFWFHPLVWLACSRLAMEAERACDDLVLTAGTRSSVYAEELLAIASTFHSHPALAAAALTMARPSTLETRLRGILDATRNRRALTRTAVLAALVLAMGIIVPLACMKGTAPAAGLATQPATTASAGHAMQLRLILPPEDKTTPAEEFADPANAGKTIRLAKTPLIDETAMVVANWSLSPTHVVQVGILVNYDYSTILNNRNQQYRDKYHAGLIVEGQLLPPQRVTVYCGTGSTPEIFVDFDETERAAAEKLTAAVNAIIQRQPGAAIQGQVLDKPGGKGVAGVTVYLVLANYEQGAQTAVTDADGKYIFKNAPPVNQGYVLRLGQRMESQWSEDLIFRIAPRDVGTTMKPGNLYQQLASVAGRVLDAQTRQPVPKASVQLTYETQNGGYATTDEQGRYRFNLLPRTCKLDCSGAGEQYYPAEPQTLTLVEGQHLENVDILVKSAPGIDVQVVNADGSAAAGVATFTTIYWMHDFSARATLSATRARLGLPAVAAGSDIVTDPIDPNGMGAFRRGTTDATGHLRVYLLRHREFKGDEVIQIQMLAQNADQTRAGMLQVETTTLDPTLPPAQQLRLAPTASVEFTILDGQDQPAVDGQPDYFFRIGQRDWSVFKDSLAYYNVGHPVFVNLGQGKFRAEGLIPGVEYTLQAAESLPTPMRDVIAVTPKPGDKITGKVLRLIGQPATQRGTTTQAADKAGKIATASRPANGRWWEDEPGWSKEVDGLKVQLTGGRYLAPKLGLEVSLRFWNTSGTVLAIAPGDPTCYQWELRDAKDQIVTPEKPDEVPANPGWMYLSPAQSGVGRILGQSSENRDGALHVGNQHWKLKPGTYAILGTFSNPANAVGQRAGTLWKGKMDLVPLRFTVLDAVTPEALQAAAAKINAQNIADLGQRYTTLAALIQPGMTYTDLQIVLPPVKDDVGFMMWNGNSFMGRYSLAGGYRVEATGFGQRDAAGKNVEIILTQTPQIIPPQPATAPATHAAAAAANMVPPAGMPPAFVFPAGDSALHLTDPGTRPMGGSTAMKGADVAAVMDAAVVLDPAAMARGPLELEGGWSVEGTGKRYFLRKHVLEVTLNHASLLTHGLTSDDVRLALEAQHLRLVAANIGAKQTVFRFERYYLEPSFNDLKMLVVHSASEPQPILSSGPNARLSDLGTLIEPFEMPPPQTHPAGYLPILPATLPALIAPPQPAR